MSCIIQSYEGPLTVDYEKLRGIVKDIVSGGTRGIRREKPGIAKVLVELTSCPPALAVDLGIGTELVDRISKQTANLAEIRAARVIVDKMAEVLEETEACLEDEREGAIGLVVDSVRRASRQHPTALVSFEEAMRYHGQVGVRAAKTRVKHEKQEKQALEARKAAAPAADAVEVDSKAAPVDSKAAPVNTKAPPVDSKAAPVDSKALSAP